MAYTFEDFRREWTRQKLAEMTPEERMRGLPPEDLLRRLRPEDRLLGLSDEELVRLKDLLERRISGQH